MCELYIKRYKIRTQMPIRIHTRTYTYREAGRCGAAGEQVNSQAFISTQKAKSELHQCPRLYIIYLLFWPQ